MPLSDTSILNLIKQRTELDENGCRIWLGATDGHYPIVGRRTNGKHKIYRLHRELYRIVHGSSELVLHKCGNGRCLNINHLYSGTYRDNRLDRINHIGF